MLPATLLLSQISLLSHILTLFLSTLLTLEYVVSQLVPSYISRRCLGFIFSSYLITIQSLHSFEQRTLSLSLFSIPTQTSYLKSFPSMPAGTIPLSSTFPQILYFNSCNILQLNRLIACMSFHWKTGFLRQDYSLYLLQMFHKYWSNRPKMWCFLFGRV